MEKEEIIEKLRDDENYYGDFGKQYLSNSDIPALLRNPLAFKEYMGMTTAFLVGGYFHTAILEPAKLKKYRIIEASTRATKKYKEISDGEMCLLQHEVDQIELMQDRLLGNDVCNHLIRNGDIEYEVPNVTNIGGNMWKGKADIINHDDRMIIDLKTTGNISAFRSSAYKYNYDSQAYIYTQLFKGYDFTFVVIDKTTLQIGVYDCSSSFYQSGQEKVEQANLNYDLFFKLGDTDPNQFLTTETL